MTDPLLRMAPARVSAMSAVPGTSEVSAIATLFLGAMTPSTPELRLTIGVPPPAESTICAAVGGMTTVPPVPGDVIAGGVVPGFPGSRGFPERPACPEFLAYRSSPQKRRSCALPR